MDYNVGKFDRNIVKFDKNIVKFDKNIVKLDQNDVSFIKMSGFNDVMNDTRRDSYYIALIQALRIQIFISVMCQCSSSQNLT